MRILLLSSLVFVFLAGCSQEYDERLEGTWYSNKERTLEYLTEEIAAEEQAKQVAEIKAGEHPINDFLKEEVLSEILQEGLAENDMYAYLQEHLGDMGFEFQKNKTRVLFKSDPELGVPFMKYEVIERKNDFVVISVESNPKAKLTFEENCYYIEKGSYREYFCKEN